MNLLAPETIDLASLPSLPLVERKALPNVSGIYFVLSSHDDVLYIGLAQSLCMRWRIHHRIAQFTALSCVRIAWLVVSDTALLVSIEKALIDYFSPTYNHQPLPRGKVVTTTIRMPADVLYEAKHYLKLQGKSFNQFCNEVITQFINDYRQAHPGHVPAGIAILSHS